MFFTRGFIAAGLSGCAMLPAQQLNKPNVVLIITDDQGYGDLGFTGNPHVKTPVLDKFARESIKFNNFYVSPVSAPTRSSIMTGRYSLRTGVRDTYNGGAIMASSEVTIAEVLKEAGYTTGQYGKWHLGDNYPCRPIDQGFDESLMHLGGGMGQPGDITTYFRGDSSYFDPVLWHNGKPEKYSGYCSDIFAAGAIEFIAKNKNGPFFCYLAFNAPHTPLQVPVKYYQIYKDIDPSEGFEGAGKPAMSDKDKEDARKVYAMVSNIDYNIGRVLKKLDDLNISDNTIVIFMTDNGPQQTRYIAGMRGLKGSVYRGGVRVPFFIRYPAQQLINKNIEAAAAHIDILPTLSQICNVDLPGNRKIDGKSLLSLMKGDDTVSEERALFFYWTRHTPELYNNIALHKGRYKLVGHTDYDADIDDFELFDIQKDQYERKNIVKEYPEIASELKSELDQLLKELLSSENLLNPPCIEVGSKYENPVYLNRNDADGQWGIWEQEEIFGLWRIKIIKGKYNLRFKFIKPVPPGGKMMVETGAFISQARVEDQETDLIEMKDVSLPSIRCDFVPFYLSGSMRIFPLWVEMERKDTDE